MKIAALVESARERQAEREKLVEKLAQKMEGYGVKMEAARAGNCPSLASYYMGKRDLCFQMIRYIKHGEDFNDDV